MSRSIPSQVSCRVLPCQYPKREGKSEEDPSELVALSFVGGTVAKMMEDNGRKRGRSVTAEKTGVFFLRLED